MNRERIPSVSENMKIYLLKRLIFLSFLFVLVIARVPAVFGAEWAAWFQSQAGNVESIDTTSIVHLKNGNARAWNQFVHKEEKHGRRELYEVNCQERSYTIRKVMAFGEYDSVQESNDDFKLAVMMEDGWNNPTPRWDYFKPVDRDEEMYKVWCGTRKKKSPPASK